MPEPTMPPKRDLLLPLARLYAHLELPRYGYFLHFCGMNSQEAWRDAPTVQCRERFFGLRVRLDLADFFQRIAYYFGCYNELDVLSAVSCAVRPGDECIDGGANIGLVTLHMAGCVGPTGRVHAFEPGPKPLERLRWHVEHNRLTHVVVHAEGLSDEPATLEYKRPGFDNLANGTLGAVPERYGDAVFDRQRVRVVRGDDVIDTHGDRPLFIKLDVEGFEHKALQGFRNTIESRSPAVLLEVNGEMLDANGSTPEAVHDELARLGYVAFALDRSGFRRRHRLFLHRLTRKQVGYEKDVLWLRPGTVHWTRAEPHMLDPTKHQYWRHILLASRGYDIY
ncbi:MAG: FkbM family methyltransferase [Phycisphaerales bacterium]|nr:FkbM family methyltransferase [Phycisphaerales bacterium]